MLPEISETDLAKCKDNLLNADQLNFLLSPTPAAHKYERPAKGGGKWTYVTGTYVKKVLNLMFGWNWNFEIVDQIIDTHNSQVIVKGKLSVRSGELGSEIVRMQFGRQDIKFKKALDAEGKKVCLDLGNDLKGATTDALKKCASELGIASDVYAPNEYKEIHVVADPDPRSEKELKALVDNAENLDELQNLYDSFSQIEKDTIIEYVIAVQTTLKKS